MDVKKWLLCYNDNGDNMKSRKVLIYILVTVILGSLIYLIIARQDAKEPIIEEEKEKMVAITEEIEYEKYIELRSKAHEKETYAIVIYDSADDVSLEFVDEVKVAFAGRKSVVYLFDQTKLDETQFSVIIDDVTEVMKYKNPQIIIPTIIVMNKGEVVYSHAGLMYKEELMENLNAKSIE